MMPIVTLLDSTFNPLALLGVWSPIPDTYFAPENCSMKFTSTLPYPQTPFRGFFLLPETSPELEFRRYKFTQNSHLHG